jgi:diguanylate cyclase (GGDEF)-like protein
MSEVEARAHRPPFVLLANDQEWSGRSLESILSPKGYAVLRAYTAQQALDIVRTTPLDVLVLDTRLSDVGGVELCERLRASGRVDVTTPIIITSSGHYERGERLAAHRAGAWEFFAQPLDAELFLLKLKTFVDAKRRTDAMLAESLLDEETGLYSLRGLARRAQEIGAAAQRRHEALAFVALAADSPPGSGAEAASTALLTRAADLLRHTSRAADAIGRFGPLEFAIIAPGAGAAGARRLVERLRESLQHDDVDPRRTGQLRLRAGICAVPDFAEASVDAVEMLLRATSALRQHGDTHGCETMDLEDPRLDRVNL